MNPFDIVPFAETVCQRRLGVKNILIRQHGEETASFFFEAGPRQSNIHSATKSVVSLAVGMAVREGCLKLTDKPVQVLSTDLPDDYDPAWDTVTLTDLLTMSSGHLTKLLSGYSKDPNEVTRDRLDNENWINFAFSNPLDTLPGTRFVYNNACPIIAARMISKAVGQPLMAWLKPRLFDPLGIRNPQWLTEPDGAVCGAGGLQLTPRQLSDIAQLCLQNGRWEGRELVPAEYIREATKPHIKTGVGSGENPGSLTGYGYYFWIFSDGLSYCLNGWGGQYGIVLPKLDATVTIMSHELIRNQEILDAVWNDVVPQLQK